MKDFLKKDEDTVLELNDAILAIFTYNPEVLCVLAAILIYEKGKRVNFVKIIFQDDILRT